LSERRCCMKRIKETPQSFFLHRISIVAFIIDIDITAFFLLWAYRLLGRRSVIRYPFLITPTPSFSRGQITSFYILVAQLCVFTGKFCYTAFATSDGLHRLHRYRCNNGTICHEHCTFATIHRSGAYTDHNTSYEAW